MKKKKWVVLIFGLLAVTNNLSNITYASENVTDLTPAENATADQETKISGNVLNDVEQEVNEERSLPLEAYAQSGLTPIYRVYNPNSGEHLHTLSSEEKDGLMSVGWVYEGISMQIDNSGNSLYRMYNSNSGEHFYTKDIGEKDNLKAEGWQDEGVAWNTPDEGIKVYRVYNPNSRNAGGHHYTLVESEKNDLINKGWRDEGISWMVSGEAEFVKTTSFLATVPYVSQYTPVKAPWGCASASLAMLLGSKNINPDLRTMQNNLPMYPNNNDGQKGDVYSGVGFGWVIRPNALASYGKTFGGDTNDISGESTVQIINRVLSGQPVLYYGFSSYQNNADTNRNHCKVIAGYKDGKFLVYDPLYYSFDAAPGSGGKNMKYDLGARAWISMSQFNSERDGRGIVIE